MAAYFYGYFRINALLGRILLSGQSLAEEVRRFLWLFYALGEGLSGRWPYLLAFLAVTAAVLCLLVRQQQPQLGGLCAVAAGAMLLLAALEQLSDVQDVFARLTSLAGLEKGYLDTLVKVLGVSYVAELAAQACEDLGEGGLALKVGLVGKLCVFTLTAPMLLKLMEMILELTP